MVGRRKIFRRCWTVHVQDLSHWQQDTCVDSEHLPSSALEVHEEAWNAYPYTKTRYCTPMMDRFSIEVETIYRNNHGTEDNVFNLSPEELKRRIVDVMDFVKDPLPSNDYCAEEDPKIFHSQKTNRGPLSDDWVEEFVKAGKPIMCAYKICRVEFRYWGMQTRAEQWIHDLALRNTMLRAHRQAWAWQDEWVGLNMTDIRRLEIEAAEHLSSVMTTRNDELTDDSDASSDDVYFDCNDGSTQKHKPSIIRWSSELELETVDEHSPPPTPYETRAAALLIMVFHGEFCPDNPLDSKTNDTNTFKSTIDTLIQRHYPQLRGRVHVVMAIDGAIRRANETYNNFLETQQDFHGELCFVQRLVNRVQVGEEPVDDTIFVVGDAIGGLLLYEAMTSHETVERSSDSCSKSSLGATLSNNATGTPRLEAINSVTSKISRSSPALLPQPTAKKKASVGSSSADSVVMHPRLIFQPSTAFLLGCPLGLVLVQRKLTGCDVVPLESCQMFNLYYSLDPCGVRLEPILNYNLSLLPPANVPRYQRYPLGDGRSLCFDSSVDHSSLWGSKRMDHILYCPSAMMALPSSALPNILHASYWESFDATAFLLREFVRSEETMPATLSATLTQLPLKKDLPPLKWKRRRTRFKVANLSPNHRANDVVVVAGSEVNVTAKFCYGPMDLAALTREQVSVFVCPQSGDWYELGVYDTDSHGRLMISLGKSLPCGIHSIKMVVHGDRSYLDSLVAIVPSTTHCVVFSVDGSLTASVSVTGRDPRVRPGAVDVVRYWYEQGYVILYLTARPDMQQRVVSAWLAQHCFPRGLLLFNPSFSTDPLKQKSLHLKQIIDMGIRIQAAYGSSKDVAVYSGAGMEVNRIVSVAGSRRRSCVVIDNYCSHLDELTDGTSKIPQSVELSEQINTLRLPKSHQCVQRTASFTPRGGKFENERQ
ncbi:LNS2 (Lipin/Ned1/Smp2) [Parelaphostrongylus tenuis]|uniref:LNS2 (Lipin/Ned1/Smp2) n=1 Tax=Parelaphostrongylus tenuis TaxID=148309 RepID=A0AAD5RDI5_PARTN|nr:LNS2 (Lipin/Ned1/Smp2) [Parelaphostrongylus tenuis]